jgi:hypothetical protein
VTPNPSVKRTIVQEGIPEFMPPEVCRLGCQEALAQLANLV